jgi:hypothetical protein
MTKREVWNHFRTVLLEDEGKSKYASVFALLGVNEWDDMAMLDESDLIDSFPVTTARAITITMKFWAKGDDDREAVILKLANRSQFMSRESWQIKQVVIIMLKEKLLRTLKKALSVILLHLRF